MTRVALAAVGCLLLMSGTGGATERFIAARTDTAFGNRWTALTPLPSNLTRDRARVGRAECRRQLKVRKGDVVWFVVESGQHGVIFENAKDELARGAWEVVTGTGALEELPEGAGFDRFNRRDALASKVMEAGGRLIAIRIHDLESGADNGILFASNPHSTAGDPESAEMLGVILIDRSQDSDRLTSLEAAENSLNAMAKPYEHAWRHFAAVNRELPDGSGRVEWQTWMRTRTLFANPEKAPSWGEQPTSVILLHPFFDDKRINKIAFDYLVDNNLFNIEGQEAFLDTRRNGDELQEDEPASRRVRFPPGSMTLRVEWRSIPEGDRHRFITADYTDERGSKQLYGLMAMHIGAKDIPNWFWATFQHASVEDPLRFRAPQSDDEELFPGDPPANMHLEGTRLEHYSLMGVQNAFTTSRGVPRVLHNALFEAGFSDSSSCMTCHSRIAIGRAPAGNESARRLDQFETFIPRPTGPLGTPKPEWFFNPATGAAEFVQLDFFWSFKDARRKRSAEVEAQRGEGSQRKAPEPDLSDVHNPEAMRLLLHRKAIPRERPER